MEKSGFKNIFPLLVLDWVRLCLDCVCVYCTHWQRLSHLELANGNVRIGARKVIIKIHLIKHFILLQRAFRI
jgi:hypothetical protein